MRWTSVSITYKRVPFGSTATANGLADDEANPIPQPWILSDRVCRGLLYWVTDPGVVTGSVLAIGLGGSARIH
jgi:hypothetical protein